MMPVLWQGIISPIEHAFENIKSLQSKARSGINADNADKLVKPMKRIVINNPSSAQDRIHNSLALVVALDALTSFKVCARSSL